MEKFKIELFSKENPGKTFRYTPLNRGDSSWILKNALKAARISNDIHSTQSLFIHLDQGLENLIVCEDHEIEVLLLENFDSANIDRDSLVFLIWDFETEVDQFILQDFLDVWEYIWYGPSDEAIIVYCPNMNKLVLITDRGYIKTN